MHTLHTQAFDKGPYGHGPMRTNNCEQVHDPGFTGRVFAGKKKVPIIPGACTIVDPGSPQFSGLKIHSKHTHVTHACPINTYNYTTTKPGLTLGTSAYDIKRNCGPQKQLAKRKQ
jgi:hypothetical protein